MITYLVFSAICLLCIFGYKDSSAKTACFASALFFYATALLNPLPEYDHEMFVFFCANLALMWVIKSRLHYLLCFVCAFGLNAHALGYLVFEGYIGNYLSIYNPVILIVNYLFIFLIVALSDAGLYRIAQGRDLLTRVLARLEVGL